MTVTDSPSFGATLIHTLWVGRSYSAVTAGTTIRTTAGETDAIRIETYAAEIPGIVSVTETGATSAVHGEE